MKNLLNAVKLSVNKIAEILKNRLKKKKFIYISLATLAGFLLFGGIAFGHNYYLKDNSNDFQSEDVPGSSDKVIDQEEKLLSLEAKATSFVEKEVAENSEVKDEEESNEILNTTDQANEGSEKITTNEGSGNDNSEQVTNDSPVLSQSPVSVPSPSPSPVVSPTPEPSPITSRIQVRVYFYTSTQKQYPAQHTHVTITNFETGELIDSGDTNRDGEWNSRVGAKTEIVVTATDYGVSKQLNTGPYGTMQTVGLNYSN